MSPTYIVYCFSLLWLVILSFRHTLTNTSRLFHSVFFTTLLCKKQTNKIIYKSLAQIMLHQTTQRIEWDIMKSSSVVIPKKRSWKKKKKIYTSVFLSLYKNIIKDHIATLVKVFFSVLIKSVHIWLVPAGRLWSVVYLSHVTLQTFYSEHSCLSTQSVKKKNPPLLMPSSSFRFDHAFTPKLEFSIWVKSFDLKKKKKGKNPLNVFGCSIKFTVL